MRCVIGVSRCLVVAVDVTDLIVAIVNLPQQLTMNVIEVQVHPARTVAGQQDMLVGNPDSIHSLLADILIHLLFYHLLTHGRQRIAHEDAQAVLMTVQRIDSHLRGIGSHHDAWDITVSIHGNLQLAGLPRRDVKTPYRCRSILLAGNRIFISIGTGIVGIGCPFRVQTLIERHGEFLHRRLVKAYPN